MKASEITSRFVNKVREKCLLVCGCAFVLVVSCALTPAQNSLSEINDRQPHSLSEIRHGDKALLIVLKSSVISADEGDRSLIDLVLRADPEPSSRHRMIYGTLAKKLNGYIRKHQSLTPASHLSEADLVICFSLIEYREILNTSYPFGELFIIVKGEPRIRRPPRIIWKSRKVLWAGDAINEFLRELRSIRGES